MHVFCFFNGAVDEHFCLVELVHADDTAGVFACGAGFAAVAGGPAEVFEGTILKVEDFVGVIAGEGDL